MRPFRRLLGHMEPDQPIYGVLSQAFLGERIVLMRVEELAAYYVQAIQTLRPHGPYHFLGFSFGGYLAFEMAQQLHARGEPVGLVGMLDNLRMGSVANSGETGARQSVVTRRWKQILMHLGHLVKPDPAHYFKREFRARILKGAYAFLYARGAHIPRFLQRPNDINWFAAKRYVPRFYPGRVTLFQASASANLPQSTNNLWAELAGGGIELVGLPGGHENILREPNVRSLAKAVTDCLANAQRSIPC